MSDVCVVSMCSSGGILKLKAKLDPCPAKDFWLVRGSGPPFGGDVLLCAAGQSSGRKLKVKALSLLDQKWL